MTDAPRVSREQCIEWLEQGVAAGAEWFNDVDVPAWIEATVAHLRTPNEHVSALAQAAGDTGNAEADRVLDRLASSDPDFDDCTAAAVLIRKLVVEHKGPEGFATWKDAAIAERLKRSSPAASPVQQPAEPVSK
jgi:hypothetical protein